MNVLLETDRLILRRFSEADGEDLVELDSDPEVMRYCSGGPPTPREVVQARVLPRFLRYEERRPRLGHWAAIEKATGDFLGWFCLRPRDDGQPFEVELGYRLRRSAWGKGYATEGARALLRMGFGELGVDRVVATTYEANLASRRVLEKAGLVPVRRFRMTAEEAAAAGTYQVSPGEAWDGEDIEYALERHDWERRETGGSAGGPGSRPGRRGARSPRTA